MSAEELLSDRKVYVCDQVSELMEGVLRFLGLNKWAKWRLNERLNRKMQGDWISMNELEYLLHHDESGLSINC